MNVLITGGSRGIGAACVRAFCKRGDRVVFFYKTATAEIVKKLERETGAVGIRADVSDPEAVAGAMEEVGSLFGGRVDVLVNNAGISQIKLFTDLTDAEWHNMIANDLDSVFYVTRAVAKLMIREQSGRIVNIGSMWGKCGASCEVHYSAAKAGVRGLTKALAKELGPSHVTVNCVEPGVIETDMNAVLDEKTKEMLCDETPLCRMGTPEEVASAVLFFASDSASFITGQILGVDGGYAI